MKPDDEMLPYDANDGVFDGFDGVVNHAGTCAYDYVYEVVSD